MFTTGSDPVRIGLVENIHRPGGNVTGIAFAQGRITGNRMGQLHEPVPRAFVLAVLLDPNSPASDEVLEGVEEARRSLGRRIEIVEARTGEDLDAAFARIGEARAGALLVHGGSFFLPSGKRSFHLRPATSCPRAICGVNMSRPEA